MIIMSFGQVECPWMQDAMETRWADEPSSWYMAGALSSTGAQHGLETLRQKFKELWLQLC